MARSNGIDILLVAYAPPVGAIAEIFATLARELSAICRVAVLAPHDLPVHAPALAGEFRFPYSSRRPDRALVGAGWRSHRAAARCRPLAVLLFTQHPLNIAAVAHFRASRLLFWWHEPTPRGQVSHFKAAIYRLNDLVVAPRADAIVVAAPSVADAVPRRHRPKTSIVPFPAIPDFERPSDRFAGSPTDLVFFGKVEPYKGLDTLAEALRLLASRGIEPTVRIVGAGSIGEAAPQMAQFATLHPERVDRVDEYAGPDDIAAAIDSAAAVVLPYLSAAGSSTLAITGALAAPVIASRTGCFADFTVDGQSSILVPPGNAGALADAIARVLSDARVRDLIGAGLRKIVRERFDGTVIAESLYTLALGRPTASRGTPPIASSE
jgi:glycosyltransferase involved in cell wall biosynthesis